MKTKIINFLSYQNGLYPILIGAVVVILLIVLRYWNLRRIKKDKVNVIQAAEMHHKTIITRDQYHLQTQKHFIPDSQITVIAVHTLQGQKDDFKLLMQYCKQQQWSLLAFDRRGEGKNLDTARFSTFATDVNDVNDVVSAVKAKFPQQKILLLGEGLGASLVTMAAKKNHQVDGVIISNLITKYHLSSFSVGFFMRLVFGFCFSRNISIPFYIDPKEISNNSAYITNVNQRYSQKLTWTIGYWWQLKTLNQTAVKTLTKLPQPTLILQTADDVFSDFHQLKVLNQRLKSNQVYHFIFSGKHVLSNEMEMKDIFFEKIVQWSEQINNQSKMLDKEGR